MKQYRFVSKLSPGEVPAEILMVNVFFKSDQWNSRLVIRTSGGRSVVVQDPKEIEKLADAVAEAQPGGVNNWMEFLDSKYFVCGLCGNHGEIPAHSVVTPTGVPVSITKHFCICPNGRKRKEIQGASKARKEGN